MGFIVFFLMGGVHIGPDAKGARCGQPLGWIGSTQACHQTEDRHFQRAGQC
ncbi:MAG: hypothetical protein K1Y36_15805 [Blastocatellia bacterium]|nr:hypothetical protein [Blastocatellia bacterium]